MSRTTNAKRLVYTAVLTAILIGTSASTAVYAASDRHRDSGQATVRPASYSEPDANTNSTVPAILAPPAGQVLIADFTAAGVQVYRCTTGTWTFVEPAANLLGRATRTGSLQTAIHFRGPSWESTGDGSLVEAKAIVSSPVAGSIPQLLLQATTNRGDGLFGHATYVQRLETSGGSAPAGSCLDGQTSGVPYRAEYRFYEAAAG